MDDYALCHKCGDCAPDGGWYCEKHRKNDDEQGDVMSKWSRIYRAEQIYIDDEGNYVVRDSYESAERHLIQHWVRRNRLDYPRDHISVREIKSRRVDHV